MPHAPLQAIMNAAPTDTPGRWLDRLARAYASGLIDGAEARRRLDAYTTGLDAKTARFMHHRFQFLAANVLPKDAPGIVAGCVKEIESAFGGLLQHVPQWVRGTRNRDTARLYARLYFFALALGWRGRDFEMAQGVTAKLFNCDGGMVRGFIRKAVKHGFVWIVSSGRPHGNGAHGRGTVYRLIHSGGAVDDATGFMHGLLLERLPCLVERRVSKNILNL